MRNLIVRLGLGLTLALGIGAAPLAGVARAEATSVKPKKPDMHRVEQHLREHVKYPATRQEVLDACAQTKEFSAAEKAWAAAHLPDGNYQSADQVLAALGK
jgi:hypothetical protein